MFNRLITAGALFALALSPVQLSAQDSDEAESDTAMAAPDAPTAPVALAPINYNAQEDRENILVLDLSNGKRVQIRLMEQWAPAHIERIKTLTRQGFYDGVVFHRVIDGFMAQTGDPTGTGRGGPGYKFADELPKPREYEVGSLAMANAGPNTNGSQFFIVSGPSGVGLPPSYSLFGKVVKGLDIVDTMQNVPTGGGDKPKTDVVINSVEITVADD